MAIPRCFVTVSVMEYHHLAIGLLALLGCINAEGFLGSGVETVYKYVGDVRAGSNFPAEFASQFGIKADLKVQSIDESKAIFQFSDVSYQVSTGQLADQEFPNAKFIPAPVESASLKEPFQVIYEGGKVKSVLTVDEPEWSENIKKAVAAIFQLDVPDLHFDKPNAFVTEEQTLYGLCTVGYTVQPQGDDYVDVLKTQDYSKCKHIPHRLYTNGIYEDCPYDHHDDSLLYGSTRYYKLYTADHKMQVKEIFSQSATAAVPFHGKSDDQTILVRQNFTFVSVGPIKEELHFTPKHEVKDLKYVIPHFYNEAGTFNDLTGGRDVKSKDEMMEKAHKTLGELVDFMETIKVTEEPEKLNNYLTQSLVYYFGQLDEECLMHCFEKYMKPKDYREETLRGAFVEVAAQVGSKASILFMRDVIIKHKIPESIAIEILRLVPFYIREPSLPLLKEYEVLMTADVSEQIKKTAILSVSSFAFMTYKEVHDVEIINYYADKFYKSFKDATDYGCKINYLSALVNLEEGKVFDYLMEIINDKTYSHHLRYIALWGTKPAATKNHVMGYKLYWPIFSNRDEEIDMRAAAMKLIMITEPTFDRFLSIFWFMQTETHSQLYYYYYTGIESYMHTNHPCFKTIGHYAERLFRYAKKPVTTFLFTGDYLMDYMDPKHSLGGNSMLSLIGDSYTGAPDTIYYSQGGYMAGYNHEYFGVLVRLTGVAESIKNQVMNIDKEAIKMGDLKKLLSSLYIKPAPLEPFHVEVVFYTNLRAVETRFYNEKNYLKFVDDFKAFDKSLKGDYRMKHHNVIFAGVFEYMQPTDIGLPAFWDLEVPYSLSINADFTHDLTGPRITRKNAIEVRYGRYGGHSLSFYNPIGGIWQGAYRSHSYMFTLPIYNHLSIDVSQKHFKFAITRDPKKDFNMGVAYHVRSQVFATDYAKTNVLHESCPTCSPYVTVHAPGKVSREYNVFDYDSSETGLEYKMNVFDCDQPHTPYDLASILYESFEEHDLNYGHNPFSHFLLGARKLHTYLGFQPAEGSCGFIFQAAPSQKYPYTQLEGVMQLMVEEKKENVVMAVMPGGKYTLRGSVTLKGDDYEHVYKTYDINVILEQTHDHVENHLNVKITRTTPKEKDFKFCMDVENKYPEIPSDIMVVRKESEEDVTGKFSVIWGESSDGKCPTDGSGFKVTLTASVPHMEDKEHSTMYPYSVCHHEMEEPEWKGKPYTPITYACFQSALDSTTLRKFTGYMNYFNIPDEYVTYGINFVNFMKAAGEFHLLSFKEEEKTTDVDKPTFTVPPHVKGKHGEMKYLVEFEKDKPNVDLHMSWDGYDHEYHYNMKYDVFGYQPFFRSSRFFLLKRFAYESGIMSSCVVTPSTVLTLDNDTYHYHSSHCYTLVSADCSEHPRYAVFTKKVEGPYDLAVKIYVGGHYLEIIPDAEGHFDVNVNGQQVVGGLKNGYQYPEDEKFYYFKVMHKDGFVNVYSKVSHVEVDYTGHSVTAVVPFKYRGIACGLCGDFNGDEVYYERKGNVSHDCHNSHYDVLDGDYMGYRYTIKTEECSEVNEEMSTHVKCVDHHH